MRCHVLLWKMSAETEHAALLRYGVNMARIMSRRSVAGERVESNDGREYVMATPLLRERTYEYASGGAWLARYMA